MLTKQMSYRERAEVCTSKVAQKLLTLLDDKKTNLALSADVNSADELIHLAETLGPDICVLKTHIDIISDFTPSLTQTLSLLAKKHEFLLFEDRKFADIGNTVKQQYRDGIYKIVEWADIINAHALPGPGIIQGLQAATRDENRALLLLAEMSSAGHLMDKQYQQQTLQMAEQFEHFVIGFITQHALSKAPQWIYFTPGIKLDPGKDNLGQQYTTPAQAILEQGSDIIIVGRDIINAKDPAARAKEYREKAWLAYLTRCQERSVFSEVYVQ